MRALGVSDPLLDEGLDELVRVVEGAQAVAPGVLVADLRIARGLDYYTGTVYETTMAGHEDLGSICSGGRYDALASDGRTHLPGGRDLHRRDPDARPAVRPRAGRREPFGPDVRARRAWTPRRRRTAADAVATALRARGIPCEVAPGAAKYGRQIRYAERRGIPYVWFPGDGSVRDIRSGEQAPADAATWRPPDADLRPSVVAVHPEPPGAPEEQIS